MVSRHFPRSIEDPTFSGGADLYRAYAEAFLRELENDVEILREEYEHAGLEAQWTALELDLMLFICRLEGEHGIVYDLHQPRATPYRVALTSYAFQPLTPDHFQRVLHFLRTLEHLRLALSQAFMGYIDALDAYDKAILKARTSYLIAREHPGSPVWQAVARSSEELWKKHGAEKALHQQRGPRRCRIFG